jgi:hypothetical protein
LGSGVDNYNVIRDHTPVKRKISMRENDWNIVRTLRVDGQIDRALKRIAKAERLTVSDIMRRALIEYLERHKERTA